MTEYLVQSAATSLPPLAIQDLFTPLKSATSLPAQPEVLGPVLDPESLNEPLVPFSEEQQAVVFGARGSLDSEISVPQRPTDWKDPYLYPSLARNEDVRLQMLWYYTRNYRDDTELLQNFTHILELVKQSMPWEFSIIGLVEADTFSRIVTAGTMELAKIPRRESPCAHTINQHPGTVFTVRDMAEDWRFQHAPTAGTDGLRSYAGTQITLAGPGDVPVVLGSICVASRHVELPLTEEQKRSLIRASNMISNALLTRTRLRRMRARQNMMEDLAFLKLYGDSTDFEGKLFDTLRKHYPNCRMNIVAFSDGTLKIDGVPPQSQKSIEQGLWEDRDFIAKNVRCAVGKQIQAENPVRVMFGSIVVQRQVLTVSSFDMRDVFDHLDIWFISQCAVIIKDTLHARDLRAALAAKATFLSSIRHELRTPIHGILSSLELLTDELKARNLTGSTQSETGADLASFLQTIRLSGNELMTTVNNILRLNAIDGAQLSTSAATSGKYVDLRDLENDVLDELLSNLDGSSMTGLSIRFENLFAQNCRFCIDYETVKEILKALMNNSLAATSNGKVAVTASFDEAKSILSFDVVDSGTGIRATDHERIFVPFEKAKQHSKGAGLGLSLATLMAASLHGKLELITSEVGVGSHFRLWIPGVITDRISKSIGHDRRPSRGIRYMPTTFYTATQSKRNLDMLSHLEKHLVASGIRKCDTAEGSLIIMNEPDPSGEYDLKGLHDLTEQHIFVVVTDTCPLDTWRAGVATAFHSDHVFPIFGPFYSSRLNEMLLDIDSSLQMVKVLQVGNSQATSETSGEEANPSGAINSDSPPNPAGQANGLLPTTTLASEFADLSLRTASRPRIKTLLVDDNKVNLSVLQFYCKRQKYPYLSAMDGNEAVTMFRDTNISDHSNGTLPITLILMDLQMPECNGIDATKGIRELERVLQSPKTVIFMITGQDTEADRIASLEAGADAFFVKPVSLKRLTHAINQYFPD